MTFSRVLFVGAHPDDIELGAAGTICNLIEQGKEVHCYHTTSGEYKDLNGNPIRDKESVLKETRKSMDILGVEHLTFGFAPATELKFNKLEVSVLQRYILEHKIDTIFTHPIPDTYHQDHQNTHNIVVAASRRYVNNIFLWESVHSFGRGQIIPVAYVDISLHLDNKMDSLRCHTTEYVKFRHDKWVSGISSMAKYRGSQIGVHAAEAFDIIKYILF